MFGSTYFEDPSVSLTCRAEYERLWQRIAQKVEAGRYFMVAREEVLAEEIPDIAKAYGKPVADRVQRAIQQTNPRSELPKSARAAAREANRRTIETQLLAQRGRIGLVNRLWLRWFGVHLV